MSAHRELELMPPQWPIDMIREPQLEVEDILAVQSLAMGYLRKRARHTRHDRDTGKYLFTMLDLADQNDIVNGSTDTYMTCKVHKVSYDQWRMTVSFLDTTNTEMTKQTNTRDTYVFDWLENGNRQAWFTSITKKRQEDGLYVQHNDIHPVSSQECIDLQDKMLEVSQTVNPINSGSILIPKA